MGRRVGGEAAGSAAGWVRVLAPATTANLGPGFDSLGMALDWTEEVFVRLVPAGLSVEVFGAGAPSVPRDRRNLVVRGARAALAAAGSPDVGLQVRMYTRLPVGRGLGSSAAAVAAGLVGCNFALGEPLAAERLVDLATDIEGHPDNVAPAILGGFCVTCRTGAAGDPVADPPGPPAAEGRGRSASTAAQRGVGATLAVRLPVPSGMSAVAAIPDAALETRLARGVLPDAVPFEDAVANVQRAALLVAAVAAGRGDVLAEATRDRLHEPYRARLIPGLRDCLEAARGAGALGAFLSGAGPTVLALVQADREAEARVARALEAALLRAGGGMVRVVGLSSLGAAAEAAAAPPG